MGWVLIDSLCVLRPFGQKFVTNFDKHVSKQTKSSNISFNMNKSRIVLGLVDQIK